MGPPPRTKVSVTPICVWVLFDLVTLVRTDWVFCVSFAPSSSRAFSLNLADLMFSSRVLIFPVFLISSVDTISASVSVCLSPCLFLLQFVCLYLPPSLLPSVPPSPRLSLSLSLSLSLCGSWFPAPPDSRPSPPRTESHSSLPSCSDIHQIGHNDPGRCARRERQPGHACTNLLISARAPAEPPPALPKKQSSDSNICSKIFSQKTSIFFNAIAVILAFPWLQ